MCICRSTCNFPIYNSPLCADDMFLPNLMLTNRFRYNGWVFNFSVMSMVGMNTAIIVGSASSKILPHVSQVLPGGRGRLLLHPGQNVSLSPSAQVSPRLAHGSVHRCGGHSVCGSQGPAASSAGNTARLGIRGKPPSLS